MTQTGTDIDTLWCGAVGEFSVAARYIVGRDGASSRVREAIEVGLEDLAFDEPWLVLDLVVDDYNDLPTRNIQYCDRERPTTYAVMGNSRRRFEFMLKPGETAAAMIDDVSVATLFEP